MTSVDIVIRETDDLDAVRELGVRSGLDESEREGEVILVAWGAYDGEALIGAIVLEHRDGMDMVNWMSVDDGWRRRGVASRLYATLEAEARRRAVRRLWVTARNAAFFRAQGFTGVPSGREAGILLGDCPACEQYGRTCTPQALSKTIDDPGSAGGV